LLYKETLFIFSPTPPAGFPDNVYIFLNRIWVCTYECAHTHTNTSLFHISAFVLP
jgi:hypothetical protein